MKIEVFSDFSCPFCYIAKRELERAIKEAGYTGQVDIEFKSYQIDPSASKEVGQNYYDYVMAHQKVSFEEAQQMMAGIIERAKEVDLPYNFAEMKKVHTENAHRLAKWTKQFGKEAVFIEALMAAHLLEGKDLNDKAVLLAVIKKLNLNVATAKEVLANPQAFMEELDKDRYDAQQIGVQSVPFFVFENRYGIKGAEPNEVFVRTLHQAAEIAGIKPTLN
ncbi:DsbA family oxidoreductase [Lysinibacillus sp. JNUCC-52]|uniref:DsbA family oxidoreductase n=1 Tax=Lysinibacillus sp. JNUCC-52 TaxID=2792480 RepID=UPI00193677C5|nr:DsbA family oxidoreductase [Lysinibacillus sp. JNUCC-52]